MSVHQHETTGSVRQRSRDQTDGGEWYATPHDLFAFENRSFARLGKNRSCAKLVTFVRSSFLTIPCRLCLRMCWWTFQMHSTHLLRKPPAVTRPPCPTAPPLFRPSQNYHPKHPFREALPAEGALLIFTLAVITLKTVLILAPILLRQILLNRDRERGGFEHQ